MKLFAEFMRLCFRTQPPEDLSNKNLKNNDSPVIKQTSFDQSRTICSIRFDCVDARSRHSRASRNRVQPRNSRNATGMASKSISLARLGTDGRGDRRASLVELRITTKRITHMETCDSRPAIWPACDLHAEKLLVVHRSGGITSRLFTLAARCV